jgi:hypothetical protein
MSVTAAKIGMSGGVIVGIAFELIPGLQSILGGGVIPAVAVTTLGMLISNKFCKDQTWK